MSERRDRTGEGTLFDRDGAELATVAYRIGPTSPEGSEANAWGGSLFFPDPSMIVEPGVYALEIEIGAEFEVHIEPLGGGDGDGQTVQFNGVGTMPANIG